MLCKFRDEVPGIGMLKDPILTTFSSCGFSNIGSIGITSAVVGTMIPNKKHWVTKLASSAMIAGNTVCCA